MSAVADGSEETPGPDPALRPLRALALTAVALGLTATLLSAWFQDWTYDEPYHMQWSRRLLLERTGDREASFLYDSKTPITLLNVVAKEGARALGVRGWGLSFWARLPGLWYLATLAALFLMSRRHIGERAALLAVIGAAVAPNLIAHGALATVDAAFACTTLLCLWAGLAYASRPGAGRAAVAGAGLGLALATKFTAMLLVPGLAAVPAAFAWRGRFSRSGARFALDAATAAGAAVLVVNAAYLFVAFGRPLSEGAWRSSPMTALAGALPALRLPLPYDFLTGLDVCFSKDRTREWQVLLLGRQQEPGIAWYFAVSWLFKTPLLGIAGQLAGIARTAFDRRLWRDPVLLAIGANAALAWGYFSFLYRAQTGYRYVLMVVPVMIALAAAGWATARRPRALTAGAALFLAFTAAESAPYLGNHLAFTNALVLDKRLAWRTATSSIDHGQRDTHIHDWIARSDLAPLAWEPTHVRPGYSVIGVNRLMVAGDGETHRWLREHLEPVRHIGHAYLLFHVDPATYERFLDEDRSLTESAADRSLCPDGAGEEVELGAPARLPRPPEGADAFLVCARAHEGADLGLLTDEGTPLVGRPEERIRSWDQLRPGEQAWYRLGPGLHALGLVRPAGVAGRWEARRGPVSLRLLPARLLRGGYVQPVAPPADVESPTP